ncbi:hypothetical protein D3C86_1585790 [compost metagenome]
MPRSLGTKLQQRRGDLVQPAQSATAAHQQDSAPRRVQAEVARARLAIRRFGEGRHYRDAGDVDALGRDASGAHAESDLFAGGEITRHPRDHPHAMQIEIGHLHPHRRRQPLAPYFVHQDFGGQEMRADNGVGREIVDGAPQRAGAEPLDGAPQLLRGRGGIGRGRSVVEHAPELRMPMDQLDVEIGIEFAERRRDVLHHVQVQGLH